jgi:16S rRNA (guanine966-N2)-methyltransferase
MRITGGEFRGRRIEVPERAVRPALERVREAVFSSLAAVVPGCRVLDLFAGSGAYGLEAMSRGAERAVWVEKESAVFRVLRNNVATLCGEGAASGAVRDDVWAWLERGAGDGEGFNLIFADPPYDKAGGQQQLGRLLDALAVSTRLAERAILVYEQGAREEVPPQRGCWQLIRDKKYGKTRVLMYKK